MANDFSPRDIPESVDSDDNETDSGIDCNHPESTQSITSSVVNYQFLHGRRYHASRWNKLLAPNDEIEQDLMALAHHICLLVSLSAKLWFIRANEQMH